MGDGLNATFHGTAAVVPGDGDVLRLTSAQYDEVGSVVLTVVGDSRPITMFTASFYLKMWGGSWSEFFFSH